MMLVCNSQRMCSNCNHMHKIVFVYFERHNCGMLHTLYIMWTNTFLVFVIFSCSCLIHCLSCVCVCVCVVFSPLLRLSPPPSEKDYYFNLDENEGVCDLFDIPL